MGSIIKVEQESGKEYLRLNTENTSSGSQHNSSERSRSVGATFESFGANVSAKKVDEKYNEWKDEGKSLNEQVN